MKNGWVDVLYLERDFEERYALNILRISVDISVHGFLNDFIHLAGSTLIA